MRLRPLQSRLKPADGTGTAFGNLPFEMIEAIFSNLNPIERQKVRAVSRSWNQTVTQLFVLELHLKNSNLQTLLKTEGKYLYGVLSSMPEKLNLDLSSLQFDAFCARLHKLKFCGITLPHNVFLMLPKCKSLRKLSFDNVQLTTDVSTGSIHGMDSCSSNVVNLTYKFSNYLDSATTADDSDKRQKDLFQVIVGYMGNCKLLKLKVSLPANVLDECDHNLHPNVPDLINLVNRLNSTFRYRKLFNTLIKGHKTTLRKLRIETPDGIMPLLQYYRSGTEVNSERRLEKFTGTEYIFDDRTEPPFPGRFLQLLLRQDGLKTLNLKFRCVQEVPGLCRAVETITSRIMQRNLVSLRIVKLHFRIAMGSTYRNFNFAGGFQHCTNLKSLSLTHSSAYLLLPDPLRVDPTFTGMRELPRSLFHFETDFSVGTQATGMQDVDLSNLVNLKTLTLSANPLFVYNGADGRNSKMPISDFQSLISKLPALKKMSLKNWGASQEWWYIVDKRNNKMSCQHTYAWVD